MNYFEWHFFVNFEFINHHQMSLLSQKVMIPIDFGVIKPDRNFFMPSSHWLPMWQFVEILVFLANRLEIVWNRKKFEEKELLIRYFIKENVKEIQFVFLANRFKSVSSETRGNTKISKKIQIVCLKPPSHFHCFWRKSVF